MRRSARRVLAFLLLAAATARAAAAAETPVAIGEAVRIASKVLGEERTILVATPEGYARGTSRYPVVYLTDGEAHFQEVCATADFLRRNGFMPPVLVVGVVFLVAGGLYFAGTFTGVDGKSLVVTTLMAGESGAAAVPSERASIEILRDLIPLGSLSPEACSEVLRSAERILLTSHRRPDGDAGEDEGPNIATRDGKST